MRARIVNAVLLAIVLALATISLRGAPACSVNAQPALSLAPLRFIRSKVIIERGSADHARLALFDEDGGEITASGLHTDFRTQWVEWKNVVLGPGAYEAVLVTSGGCTARSHIDVHGD